MEQNTQLTDNIDPLCPSCQSDELTLFRTDRDESIYLCETCGKIFSITHTHG